MSRRDNADARCAACRMHRPLCICSLVPRLVTKVKLVLVVHKDEERKPTNTGLLAARCLANSSVLVTGHRDRPIDGALWEDHARAMLLFPAEHATGLVTLPADTASVTLVVPDGSWRQARKVRTRVPGLSSLRCVTLPSGAPTAYRLRTEGREGGLATLEAIARAIAILEGNDIAAQAMLAVFRVMVDRTLWLRGSLRDNEVAGGVPDAARAHDPRGGSPQDRERP